MVNSLAERCKSAENHIEQSVEHSGSWFSKYVTAKEAKLIYLSFFDSFLTEKSYSNPTDTNGVACTATAEAPVHFDAPDRLPLILHVHRRDIFFYCVGIFTYILDVLSDCFIVYFHFINDRCFAASLVLLFVLLPSFLLNLISYQWWSSDDAKNRKRGDALSNQSPNFTSLRILFFVLQLGPIRWYLEAIYSGVQFRRLSQLPNVTEDRKEWWFCRMVVADRDAAFLRFFEAFLESVPQLVVQGYIATNFFWIRYIEDTGQPIPVFFYMQLVSTFFSLVSVSYSMSVQHRTLRITRPEKVSMELWETTIQIFWRFLTIMPRFICIVMFILCYGYWTVLLLLLHVFVSLLHIIRFQAIVHKSITPCTAFGLMLVNSLIHTFAPFNMAEGRTRWSYTVAYSIEAIENIVMLTACLLNESFNLPFKLPVLVFCMSSFILGILSMTFYYGCCHPSRRVHSAIVGHANDEEDAALTLNQVPLNEPVVVPLASLESLESNM
ncbi:hypothetical protein L596_003816 [Steinernema carpocapsae]|uniref:XK-related protein n=1 Tax=Steinernema carpocapsae TaxID=34508 RepID=A0A4U8UTM9_STECR|nr:hypothetical protein L596_003816 [Steinernema carpocapsae]